MDVSEARRVLGVGTGADLLTLAQARDRALLDLTRSPASTSGVPLEEQSSDDERARVNQAYILLAGLSAPRPSSRPSTSEGVPRDGWFWILVVAGALAGGALTKLGSPPKETPDISQSVEWIGIALLGAAVGALVRWAAFSIRVWRKARRRRKLLEARR